MRLRRPIPRRRPETIVALIDVVFFLLVFFMLIGRMDATAPFAVTPPTGLSGSDMPAGGATLSIAATGGLAVDGVPLGRAAALARLADRIAAEPGLLVRLNADRDTALRLLLPLLGAVEALGARDVALVVTPSPP